MQEQTPMVRCTRYVPFSERIIKAVVQFNTSLSNAASCLILAPVYFIQELNNDEQTVFVPAGQDEPEEFSEDERPNWLQEHHDLYGDD